jgi:hypothetical protein
MMKLKEFVRKWIWPKGGNIPEFTPGTEKNHEKSKSEMLMLRPRFEPSTSLIEG